MNLRSLCTILLAALAALWAGAGAASATVITEQGTTAYTSTIKAESEGETTLHGAATITCGKSSVEGTIESHGESVTAEGKLSSLSFSECGSTDVTVEAAGSLIAHATEGGNGTLTSSGAKIKAQVTSLGLTCEYTTSSTHIGTITGSLTTSSGWATLDINSASIPRTGGSIFCGSSGTWTGSYKVTAPFPLLVVTQVNSSAGMSFDPIPVVFKNETQKAVTITNTGTLTLESLLITIPADYKNDFEAENDCKGASIEKEKSCPEKLKCLTVGKSGYVGVSSNSKNFLVSILVKLECIE